MKRLLSTIALLLCLIGGSAGLAATASAATCSTASNPLSCACGAGNGANTSTACSAGTTDPITGPNGILKKVSLVLATVAGITAVVIIIVGGFQIVTSAGDASKVASGRKSILGAIIGLIIVVLAESIVLFVVNKL
jgi:hypothetical protein